MITASKATLERAELVMRALVRDNMWEYYESIIECNEVLAQISNSTTSSIIGWFSSALSSSAAAAAASSSNKYRKSYSNMIQSAALKYKQFRKTQTFQLMKTMKTNMLGHSSIAKFMDCKKEFRRLVNENRLDELELITMLQNFTKNIVSRENLIDVCNLVLVAAAHVFEVSVPVAIKRRPTVPIGQPTVFTVTKCAIVDTDAV